MDVYDGEIYHFDIQQIKEKRDQAMTNVLQKLKTSTNRVPPPHTQDPSPPERKEHSRLIERSVDRIDDGAVLMSNNRAILVKAQIKISHLLRDLRIEIKKTRKGNYGISDKRMADLYNQRRILRSELAEVATRYVHLKARERRGLEGTARAPVVRPSATHTPSKVTKAALPGPADVLPIDQYREEILRRVGGSRISVIGGETGCGKSSRLPVMLLEDAVSKGRPCRIMVRT
jgi:hypothetical protein